MSIYTARPRRPISAPPYVDLANVPQPAVESAAFAPAHARRRKTQPANHLLPASLHWLESLQPQVRPVALATRYPRIVNNLASGWNEPVAMCRNFDDLVYDRRGTRRGFPTDVHRDLLTLRDYYFGYSPGASR